MKRYLLAIAAVVCVAGLVSFTTSSENSSKFVCQWFIFDKGNPAATNYPVNLTEATTVTNYVPLGSQNLSELCPAVWEICAVCAEVDINGDPILTPGSTIYDSHLAPYFAQSNETLRNPNPSFIREKYTSNPQ